MIEPVEIVSSRWKIAGLLAIGIGFVAIALWVPGMLDQWWGWPSLVLFGLCTVAAAWLLVRPQRLILNADGFTLSGGLARSPRQTPLRDVERFFVYRVPRGGKMIGYALAPHARRDTYLGDLSRRWGADGVLPKTLAGSPEAIVARLNAYREQALAVPAAPRRGPDDASPPPPLPPASPPSFGRRRPG